MEFNRLVELKECVHLLRGDRKTLVGNTDNCECIFVSNECIDIIMESINSKYTYQNLFDTIECFESKGYMKSLIEKLNSLSMLSVNNENIDTDEIKITIDITNDCNLRCKHCCVSAGEMKDGENLSKKDIVNIIDKVIEVNPMSISICGGEPLVMKEFDEITKRIKSKYSKRLTLMTNGVLIDEERAKFISDNYDAIDISIDGFDEESCSRIRGKDVFDKVIAGIKNLQKYNVKNICASMILTPHNKANKFKFVKLCKDMGIDFISREFDEKGRGLEFLDELKINDEPQIIQFEKMRESFIKNKIYKCKPGIFSCQGAKREFRITYKGDIMPCGALIEEQFNLGNVLIIDDLKKYLKNGAFKNTDGYKNFQGYMPFNIEPCKECNKNLLCFNCVNEIRSAVKNNEAPKFCEKNKEYLELFWGEYETI